MSINAKGSTGLLDYPTRFSPLPHEGDPANPQESGQANARFIVLIPSVEIDPAELKLQLSKLGLMRSQEVLLLGKYSRWATDNHANSLFRLAMDMRLTGINVTYKLVREVQDWVMVLRQSADAADIVICHEEYQGQKLQKAITAELGLTAYVMSGIYNTRIKRWEMALTRICFELLPLALIIGTFWLQVQISSQTDGLLNSVLLVLTVLFDVAVMFVWSLMVK